MQTTSWHSSLDDRTSCALCPFSGKRLRTSSLKYTPYSLQRQRPHGVICRKRTCSRHSNRNLDLRQNSFCPHISPFLFTIASISTWSSLKERILTLFTCSPFYPQFSWSNEDCAIMPCTFVSVTSFLAHDSEFVTQFSSHFLLKWAKVAVKGIP